jgi:hypothetical protein
MVINFTITTKYYDLNAKNKRGKHYYTWKKPPDYSRVSRPYYRSSVNLQVDYDIILVVA